MNNQQLKADCHSVKECQQLNLVYYHKGQYFLRKVHQQVRACTQGWSETVGQDIKYHQRFPLPDDNIIGLATDCTWVQTCRTPPQIGAEIECSLHK